MLAAWCWVNVMILHRETPGRLQGSPPLHIIHSRPYGNSSVAFPYSVIRPGGRDQSRPLAASVGLGGRDQSRPLAASVGLGGRDQSRPYSSVKLVEATFAVILSTAKNLSSATSGFFAALRMTIPRLLF